jgi:ABC-type nitrate/sulfonate/bicarbonate transport system substrate-binding protein
MKPSRFTVVFGFLAALAGFTLATMPVLAEEPFSKLVGDVKVGEVKKGDVLEVPFILWGGDVATFHANGGLETKADTIFNKQGLKLKLTAGDDFPKQVKSYLEGKSPFLRGTLSMLGLASEVVGKDNRTKPVVFLQLTWSAGDHLVARSALKTLDNLKGKKVALQKGGPHVGMLDDILRTAKLKWSDIKVVWTDEVTGDKGPAAQFRKDKDVDACFAITPDMTDLTGGLDKKGTGKDKTVEGAHVLVSTATMKRSIADVYACRKDFYDANKELVQKFAAGYLKACEDVVDLKKKFTKKDKDGTAQYKKLLKLTQDIYGKDAIKSEDDADGLISDAVFVGLPGNNSFFTNKGNLSGFEAKAKAALDLGVGQGYAKERINFLTASLDYAKLKKLGKLKADVEEETGGLAEATKVPTGEDLTDNTLYFFTVSFEPNQKEFDEDKYGDDFHRALEQASLFGNALVAVRGHGDIAQLLKDFTKAAVSKGILKRQGKPRAYEYFLKDGTKLDLSNTKKVVALIEKEDFGDATPDPKQTLKTLLKLSKDRADAVREALMKYANAKKIILDKNQIKAVGVGVLEPIAPTPRTDKQMASNRRVEFRIIRVPAEALTAKDFDY